MKGPVGLVDVAATLLDLAGLPADGLDGVSLRATLQGGPAPPGRPVYSETWLPRLHFGWSELTAASEERFRHVRAPRPELYDLATDPGETRNLAAERPQAVAAIDAWLRERAGADALPPSAVDPATRERLAALGYVGGTGRTPPGRRRARRPEGRGGRLRELPSRARPAPGRPRRRGRLRVPGRARRQPGHDRRVAGARPHARPHGPGEGRARRARPGGAASIPAARRLTSRSRASTRSPAASSRRSSTRASQRRASRATATSSPRSCCCPAAASRTRRRRRGRASTPTPAGPRACSCSATVARRAGRCEEAVAAFRRAVEAQASAEAARAPRPARRARRLPRPARPRAGGRGGVPRRDRHAAGEP